MVRRLHSLVLLRQRSNPVVNAVLIICFADIIGVEHAEDFALHFGFPGMSYIKKGDEGYEDSKDHVRLFVDFARDRYALFSHKGSSPFVNPDAVNY